MKLFSFFALQNSYFILKKIRSLPASMRTILSIWSHLCRRRTISHISLRKASLTLEAALALPLFLMACLSIIYLMHILTFQTSIQMQMQKYAHQINTHAYIVQNSNTPISAPYVQYICNSGELKKLFHHVYTRHGNVSYSLAKTAVDKQKDICNIVITYNIVIPFLPDNILTIPMIQNCQFKLFTGDPEQKNGSVSSKKVYLTAMGSVYHTNKYCTYLRKYSDLISKNSLQEYEKQSGKKLHLCRSCKKLTITEQNPVLYISSTGNAYHYSRDCYYLTSHIYEYKYEDVKEIYPLCSRCEKTAV